MKFIPKVTFSPEVVNSIVLLLENYLASIDSNRYEMKAVTFRAVYDVLKSIPNLLKIFSEADLFQEAQEMYREIITYKTSDVSLESLTKEYLEFLLKEKTYMGFVSFEGCKNIPIGKRLGASTFCV